MAHEVEMMFSVRETPWHGLGRIVREAPTSEEAIKLAGLDWRVVEQPIYWQNGIANEIETHKAVLRSDNHKLLGVVGKGYMPLQNSEAFRFFDDFVRTGDCTFETAGCLREGKRVWVLARLNRDPIDVTGKGDIVQKFLLLSNGHDGGMSVRVGFSPIRVVCANTLAMAHGSQDSQLIRIVHSTNVKYRLDQIKEIVNAANARFEATADQYRFLAKADVNQEDLRKFVKIVFRISDIETKRRMNASDKIMSDITRLFENGRGQTMQGTRGTYWALYNSVTEYLSYEKKGTDEARLHNLWFGRGQEISKLALDTALDMAAA